MANTIRVINPPARRKKSARRRTRRTASGRFVKNTSAAVNRPKRRRRRNPQGGTLMTVNRRRRRRRSGVTRRRRNPGVGQALKMVKPQDILWSTAGLVGVQTLTPMVLKMAKQPETGPIALVGKVATAIVGYMGIANFMKNKRAAASFLQGGLISVGTDVWNLYIKPRIGLGGMYEFESSGGMMGQSYMFEPMDQALLGDGAGCVPSERYLNPTDQVIVGGAAGGAAGGPARMNSPVSYPMRLTPVV